MRSNGMVENYGYIPFQNPFTEFLELKMSMESTLSVLAIDTDLDGVDNATDLDDDNDGILDEIENSCSLVGGYDGYWSYEGTTDDVSGNDHSLQGTIPPTITYGTGVIDNTQAINFDGTSTILQYSDGTFLNQAISYFSFSFWIYPTDLTRSEQSLVDEGAGGRGFMIRLNNSTLECAIRSNPNTYATSTFNLPEEDRWYHIAATYNNGILTLYLDGIPSTPVDTGIGELTSHSNQGGFGGTIGNNLYGTGAGHHFLGRMDEILPYCLNNSTN